MIKILLQTIIISKILDLQNKEIRIVKIKKDVLCIKIVCFVVCFFVCLYHHLAECLHVSVSVK